MLHRVSHTASVGRCGWLGNPVKVRSFARCCKRRSLLFMEWSGHWGNLRRRNNRRRKSSFPMRKPEDRRWSRLKGTEIILRKYWESAFRWVICLRDVIPWNLWLTREASVMDKVRREKTVALASNWQVRFLFRFFMRLGAVCLLFWCNLRDWLDGLRLINREARW